MFRLSFCVFIFYSSNLNLAIILGQVKSKRKLDDDIAEPEPEKRLKSEPSEDAASAEPEPEPKKEGLKCENCGIMFSKATAHAAHVEFYCQKRLKKE